MISMVASGDVETVKAKIQAKYGFTPTDEYVTDLIQFVNDMVAGDEDEEEDADDFDSDFDGADGTELPES